MSAPDAPTKPTRKRAWMLPTAAAVAGLAVGGAIGGSGGDAEPSPTVTVTAQAEELQRQVDDLTAERDSLAESLDEATQSPAADAANAAPAVDEEPAGEAAESAEETGDDTENSDGMTAGQENAVGSAESYLAYTSFSKKGLIDQLKFEGFDAADAKFAVQHVDVDWSEQAAKKAQEYLDTSSFSRSGLIDQLKFEGFTTEQATHGVDAAGL
ncbi:Ltp family lipoprotein [Promicromonospora sp. Marseille-Q5078]